MYGRVAVGDEGDVSVEAVGEMGLRGEEVEACADVLVEEVVGHEDVAQQAAVDRVHRHLGAHADVLVEVWEDPYASVGGDAVHYA